MKYIESLGARVVPLIMNESKEILDYKLKRINGIVYPGGNHKEADYGDMGKYIFEYAKQQNSLGNFFPVWGISLGFLRLMQYSAAMDNQGVLALLAPSKLKMKAQQYVKLQFTMESNESNIFRPMEQ